MAYLPLTYYNLKFLGLKVNWHQEKNAFFIGTDSISDSNLKTETLKTANSGKFNLLIPSYKIAINTTNSSDFVLNQSLTYPILNFRGITYLPFTWDISVGKFDWQYSFDNKKGLSIDTINVNRPILDDSKIGNTSPNSGLGGMEYAYSTDSYVGFPMSTLDENYYFIYKKKGDTEKKLV